MVEFCFVDAVAMVGYPNVIRRTSIGYMWLTPLEWSFFLSTQLTSMVTFIGALQQQLLFKHAGRHRHTIFGGGRGQQERQPGERPPVVPGGQQRQHLQPAIFFEQPEAPGRHENKNTQERECWYQTFNILLSSSLQFNETLNYTCRFRFSKKKELCVTLVL